MKVDLDRDDLVQALRWRPRQLKAAVRLRVEVVAAELHALATLHPTATWYEVGRMGVALPAEIPPWMLIYLTEQVVKRYSLDHPVRHPWRDLAARKVEHIT